MKDHTNFPDEVHFITTLISTLLGYSLVLVGFLNEDLSAMVLGSTLAIVSHLWLIIDKLNEIKNKD